MWQFDDIGSTVSKDTVRESDEICVRISITRALFLPSPLSLSHRVGVADDIGEIHEDVSSSS